MLHLQNISKHFSGIKALENVSLRFSGGEVHAICGENGAGKTTLMNIIMGNLQPDEGSIVCKGKKTIIADVLMAHTLGISIVYQERSLADSLSIAENIFPVNLPVKKTGLIDYKQLYQKAQELLNELGLPDLSPKTPVERLSIAQKQMIEIAKALAQEPALLIFDEPTASITHSETEILFRTIQKLKGKGVAIIYISHRMAEIQRISDKISVLKDGKFVATVDKNTATEDLIGMMVGRALEAVKERTHVQQEMKLEVINMSGKGFSNISFQLYKGEILGFAGLQGSGRTAMAKALFGDAEIKQGSVLKDGKGLSFLHPSEAIRHGIIYLPEERKTEGLFLEKSIAENIFSSRLTKGFYKESSINLKSIQLCSTFDIRSADVTQEVRKLSGGNQQKVVMAKWLSMEPEILIVNEPTHGIDVGAKADIYRLLKNLTAEGKSIILISSDLPELLLLSDRIAVMHEGRIKSVLNRSEATEEIITTIASGY